MRGAGRGNDDIGRGQAIGQASPGEGLPLYLAGHCLGPGTGAVDTSDVTCALQMQGARSKGRHLPGADNQHRSAAQILNFCLDQEGSGMANRRGLAAHTGFGARALAGVERLCEEMCEDRANRPCSLGFAKGVGDLAQNLGIAQNHGI